jgi:hypothetical protein
VALEGAACLTMVLSHQSSSSLTHAASLNLVQHRCPHKGTHFLSFLYVSFLFLFLKERMENLSTHADGHLFLCSTNNMLICQIFVATIRSRGRGIRIRPTISVSRMRVTDRPCCCCSTPMWIHQPQQLLYRQLD